MITSEGIISGKDGGSIQFLPSEAPMLAVVLIDAEGVKTAVRTDDAPGWVKGVHGNLQDLPALTTNGEPVGGRLTFSRGEDGITIAYAVDTHEYFSDVFAKADIESGLRFARGRAGEAEITVP